MDIPAALVRLQEALGPGRVCAGEPMRLHTTFRVGGPADIFIEPTQPEEAAAAVRICRETGVPLLVVGNGSNLLVRDGGIRGAVLHMGANIAYIKLDGNTLTAGAGALLSRVAAEAGRRGLVGMEFASGIPGSVGGAAAMNAGAYGGEMRDIVRAVRAVTPSGDMVVLSDAEMDYGYRHSRALEEGLVIAEVALGLAPGDPEVIAVRIRELDAQRRDKQPLEYPSAGSFFKRPPGHFAGKLIADAGLKGMSVGGAQVSEKHAGFVINAGDATASDILRLSEEVRRRVLESSGVALETEVRMVGEE
jgi:UDP-N-acetylmuramate dehydrogenase